MANVWAFNLENGALTGLTQSGSDMSVTTAAKLAVTSYGISALIDDTTDNYLYPTASSQATGRCRWRFYFDPNGLSMANNDEFTLFQLRYSTSSYSLAFIKLIYATVGGYRIYAQAVNDVPAGVSTGVYTLPSTNDGPHYIECDLKRATNSSSNDGSIELFIDGTSQEKISTIDNYDRFANFNSFRWGPHTTKPATTSGTFYLDELIVNNDGRVIGPVDNTTTADAYCVSTVEEPAVEQVSGATDLTVADAYSTSQTDAVVTTKNTSIVVADSYSTSQVDVSPLGRY